MEKFQLSYSSEKKCQACEQQYTYAKILKLPPDVDAKVDTLATDFGSAMHTTLEWSQHELGYFEDKHEEYLTKAMAKHNLPDDRDLKYCLAACVYSSLLLWQKTGLRVIKCELKIETDEIVGYIDLIAIDPNNGDWWIGDIKTASKTTMFQAEPHRLRRDPQLSLYASHKQLVADALGLDVNRFLGCLYRETIKPFGKDYSGAKLIKADLVVAQGEAILTYAKRNLATSHCYVIPKEQISYEPVTVHSMMRQRVLELQAGRTPIRNYSACTAYGKCCDYWSQCYGMTATQCKMEAREASMTIARVPGEKAKGKSKVDGIEDTSYSLQGCSEPVVQVETKVEAAAPQMFLI